MIESAHEPPGEAPGLDARQRRVDRAARQLKPETLKNGAKVYRWRQVLDEAYRHGFVGFELLGPAQFTTDASGKPLCVVAQRARFADGSYTDAIGDAGPSNCNSNVGLHFIRMADTRAKARALHDALNLDANLAEEFGGDEEEIVSVAPPSPRAASPFACQSCGTLIEDTPARDGKRAFSAKAKVEYSKRVNGGQILCYACARKAGAGG